MKQVGEEELEALCWTGGRGSMADPPFASQKQVHPGTAWQVPPCLVFWVLVPLLPPAAPVAPHALPDAAGGQSLQGCVRL